MLVSSPPKNNKATSILINKILAYSAKKIKANPPLLYSVLKPDTNSDSLSAKSKGVRFVSAKQDANQINLKGIVKNNNQQSRWYKVNKLRLNPPINMIKESKIKANLTS